MLTPCDIRSAAGDGQHPAAGGLVCLIPWHAVLLIASHICTERHVQRICADVAPGGRGWAPPPAHCQHLLAPDGRSIHLCHTAAHKDPEKGSESVCPVGLLPMGETLGLIIHRKAFWTRDWGQAEPAQEG